MVRKIFYHTFSVIIFSVTFVFFLIFGTSCSAEKTLFSVITITNVNLEMKNFPISFYQTNNMEPNLVLALFPMDDPDGFIDNLFKGDIEKIISVDKLQTQGVFCTSKYKNGSITYPLDTAERKNQIKISNAVIEEKLYTPNLEYWTGEGGYWVIFATFDPNGQKIIDAVTGKGDYPIYSISVSKNFFYFGLHDTVLNFSTDFYDAQGMMNTFGYEF